jgi:hypothetical protein
MGLEVIAIASLVATGLSTGISMYGQKQQAEAATAAAKYNNKLLNAEADNLATESREAQTREIQRNRRQLSALRSSLSQQGTVSSSGSPLAILGESATNLSLGIADAARRTDMQTRALRAQGQMGLWDAKQQQTATKINMVSTAIGSASKAASSVVDYKYKGIF